MNIDFMTMDAFRLMISITLLIALLFQVYVLYRKLNEKPDLPVFHVGVAFGLMGLCLTTKYWVPEFISYFHVTFS